MRARKAMQYAASIDDFARIMKDGNNGGYANNWLVADRKTNEIASLELGLKNVTLQRTKDGYFVGSNFPVNPKLTQEETDFDPNDKSQSDNARHVRWLQLMEQNKGKIDVAAGQTLPGRPLRHVRGQERCQTSARCAATSIFRRAAWRTWQAPYAPGGRGAEQGHGCRRRREDVADGGPGPLPAAWTSRPRSTWRKHPEFAWKRDILRDMPARGWARFTAK